MPTPGRVAREIELGVRDESGKVKVAEGYGQGRVDRFGKPLPDDPMNPKFARGPQGKGKVAEVVEKAKEVVKEKVVKKKAPKSEVSPKKSSIRKRTYDGKEKKDG